MIKELIHKIKSSILRRSLFVIIDPNDNSVTLSKRLFLHMKKNASTEKEARVFVFKVKQNGFFAFMVNPSIEQETQISQIQYNTKYKSIGFETLCPSVGKIIYDYGLKEDRTHKLRVSIHYTEDRKIYYQIEKR